MIIELVLVAGLIGGIIYAALNWPEIEARLFPHHTRRHDASAAAHGKSPVADVAPTPPAAEETSIAKGFMRKKEITAEPEVEPEDFHKTQGAADAAPAKEAAPAEPSEPATSAAEPKSEPEPEAAVDETPESNPAADYAASPTPPPAEPATPTTPVESPPASKPAAPSPGGHVTGAPARPSQPAYVNATAGVEERVEDLAAEADAAYRDRDYEKAEQACLKILMREPKNHKYMTRIGQIYQEMGQLDDAKEAFETAKKLDPKNFFVLNRLAEVERLLNDRGGRTSENKRSSSDKADEA